MDLTKYLERLQAERYWPLGENKTLNVYPPGYELPIQLRMNPIHLRGFEMEIDKIIVQASLEGEMHESETRGRLLQQWMRFKANQKTVGLKDLLKKGPVPPSAKSTHSIGVWR